jgi:O-antigen/teichoic acid export membrane protein
MEITNRDVVWGYLGTILKIAINVILLPVVYNFLTGQEIGIWYIYISVGSIVNLLDFGFTSTLSRNIAYSWSGADQLQKENVKHIEPNAEPNVILFKKVLKMSKFVYLAIGLIALLILLTAGTIYINYIGQDFDGRYLIESWIIYIIAVFINLYMGYFSAFLRGVGAIYQYNKALVFSKLIQIIISLILLNMNYGLIAMTSAYFLSGLSYRVLSKMFFYNYENVGYLLDKNNVEIKFHELKESFLIIWHNAWRDGLITVSKYLTTQASTILASFFLTLTQTGIYSLSLQVVTVIINVSSSLYTIYQPTMYELYIKKNMSKLKDLMATSIVIYTTLSFVGIVLFNTVGVYILEIIKPNSEINQVFILIMFIYMFLLQHHSLYASYISNTNRLPYVKSFVISSIFTIIFELLLLSLTNLGIWSLLVGPIFVQLVYNNWRWPIFVLNELNINIFEFIKLGILELYKNIKYFSKSKI